MRDGAHTLLFDWAHTVFQAEQDLQKLTVDANRSRQTLEEQMVEFERKKMEDIRVRILMTEVIFSDLICNQVLYFMNSIKKHSITNTFF